MVLLPLPQTLERLLWQAFHQLYMSAWRGISIFQCLFYSNCIYNEDLLNPKILVVNLKFDVLNVVAIVNLPKD